jgi:hypothetical protein
MPSKNGSMTETNPKIMLIIICGVIQENVQRLGNRPFNTEANRCGKLKMNKMISKLFELDNAFRRYVNF